MDHIAARRPNPKGRPSHGCGNVIWSHLVPAQISARTRISKGRRTTCLTIEMNDAPNCLSLPSFMSRDCSAVSSTFTTYANPPLTPAPIPSAFDPHTVERSWFRASRWSAPLYERP